MWGGHKDFIKTKRVYFQRSKVFKTLALCEKYGYQLPPAGS